MKMVCKRESLLSACQLASTAVPSKDVKPVLRNVKAIVDEKFCTLMATDLELGIRLEVRGIETNEPGDALFPASRLISILRESPAEELTIDAGMDATIITAGTTEFEMAGEDPAAFPDIPTFAEEKYTEMTAGVLRDMIRRVSFAVASAEHSRFGATIGVLWELEAEKATLVATDGRRLALSIGPCRNKGGHTTKGTMPVVPLKAMTLLERNLDASDELVKISFRPNEVLMKTERAMLYSRLVEGKFPNYRQAIPKDGTHRMNLTVGPFLSAVRQAAIMTDDESKRVIFTFAKGTLTLQAAGAQTGRSKVEMAVDYAGDTLAMGFDPKFIGDMLKVLEPDTPLTLDITDPNTPAVFRQDPNYLYVVVPLVTTA